GRSVPHRGWTALASIGPEFITGERFDRTALLDERHALAIRQNERRSCSRWRAQAEFDDLALLHRHCPGRIDAAHPAAGACCRHAHRALECGALAVLRRVQSIDAIRRNGYEREESAVRCDGHADAVDRELRTSRSG